MNGEMNKSSYELTPTQEAMLLYSLYAPKSAAYFEQFCYAYEGSLDVDLFQRAWLKLIDRHSSLRTSFHWIDDNSVQTVHEHADLPFRFLDWRALSNDEHEQHLLDLLKADRLEGFDVSQAPLLRVAVAQTGERAFYIVISNHHLVIDGWSMGIMRREVSEIYRALSQNTSGELPAAPEFQSYVQRLKAATTDAENFWRTELRGFSAPNNLPIDNAPRTLPTADEEFAERAIALSPATSSRLKTVARQHRLTLSTVLQSAWALLLSRYCNTDDVIFGITVSGRPYDLPEVDSVVGLLINTLPLRVRVPCDMPIADWLGQLQKKAARVLEHELLSLKQLHACSELPHNVPLFETLLVFENFVGHELEFYPDGKLELRHSHLARTNYPLALVVNPYGEFELRAVYHLSRFDDEAIERMLRHLVTILESFADGLEKRVAAIELLTSAEKLTLINEWSGARNAKRDHKPAHRSFEQRVANHPEAIAIEHKGERLTYAELNARANKMARHIRSQNYGGGNLVGICVERSIEMVVAVLGVMKAGAAYVPLDPAYPTGRLSLMLEDSGAQLLLTRSSLREKFPEFTGTVISFDDAKAIDAESGDNLEASPALNDLAYVMYTSGSTGKPKGVMIEHGALANFVDSAIAQYEIQPRDRLLQFASLCFDTSVEEIYCALVSGATLVLRNEAMLTSPKQFLETAARLGITVLDLPTGYWHHLATEACEESLPIPESLRLVILGGEQANAEQVEQWLEHTRRRTRLLNTYGPTEATVVTTVCDLTNWQGGDPLPIGRPIAGAEVYVLDPTRRLVPVGVPGELFIGGAGVACGYWNRADLTTEKFIDNPFGAGKLYRSGDLVRHLPDGDLEFLGRVDNQVKIRGFRVELEEIEQAIKTCDGVREAVVIARKESVADYRMCAYVMFDETSRNISELRSSLKRILPAHMMPSSFTVLGTLPLMPNGKIDRQALPAPDSDRPEVEEPYLAPRTPTEEIVARVWCNALKLDRVGVTDNFFELGGHSLLAARVFSDLQKKFDVELNLVDIFNAPTVADLAEMIYARETTQRQADDLISLISELDELTEDEAEARLAEEARMIA